VAIAALLVLGSLILLPGRGWSQEPTRHTPPDSGGPVTADSAAVIRASFERPPAKPPFDAVDAVALPFRVIFFPLRLLGRANAKMVGFVTQLSAPKEVSLFERLVAAGLRPRFGSIGPRSSFAAGILVDRWSPLFLESAISLRGSQRHEAGLDFSHAYSRLRASYLFKREAEPHFWGVGPGTGKGDFVDYLWDQQMVSGLASASFTGLTLVAGVGYQDNRVGRGFDGKTDDIQDSPLADSLYGVNERTRYAVINASATLDKTYNRGLQRRGFYLDAAADLFRGVDGTDSDFHRFRAMLTGFLPANPRQALALRGLAEINTSDGGRGVPFTHLATLGDVAGGRAYKDGRFRDRAVLAFMSEWRYEVWRELQERGRVESYLLLDAGTVGERFAAMRFSEVRWSYGFGMRVVWDAQERWLVYLAFGDDGAQFNISFSRIF
jgi:hypothetical protein